MPIWDPVAHYQPINMSVFAATPEATARKAAFDEAEASYDVKTEDAKRLEAMQATFSKSITPWCCSME